jgi:uncharacterized membrane protein YgcG
MKKIILTFILLFAPLYAGTVTDNANILGPRLEEFSVKIAPFSVFIESHEHLDDPRAYADTKIKELTSKGFLIVITTNPRKWRISMTPERVVSGEQTRLIGDKMMPHFKTGDYYSGLLLAANELNGLLAQDVVVEQITPTQAPSKHESLAASILVSVAVAIGLIIISYLIYKWVNKPIARVPETKEKPLYGQSDFYKEFPKFENNYGPIGKTGNWEAPKSAPVGVSGLLPVKTHLKNRSREQYYSSPSSTKHYHSNSSGPDLITPLIVYSALSSSDDDSRKKSSSSDSYSSSYSSSSYDSSSSSSSDSGGSSGGDW